MTTTEEQQAAGLSHPANGVPGASKLDHVLVLCPEYDARFPSETLWQRLDALQRLGPVSLPPIFPLTPQRLDPPAGVSLIPPDELQRRKGPLFRYPARIRELASRLYRRGSRGLIWANSNYFTRLAAYEAARVTGWPVVIDVWDVPDLPMWSQWREGRYLKSAVHWAMGHRLSEHLQAADLVIWSLHPESASRYFRPSIEKTLFLPNGIRWNALDRFRASQSESAGETRRLLYIGHFHRSRGSNLLAEMLSALCAAPNLEFHLIGSMDGRMARRALRAIPDQLKGKLHLHGHLPWKSAMKVLRSSDICLYPFPHTPELEHIYPLKLLEYAGMNKWIISSDLTGAQRLLNGYAKVLYRSPQKPAEWVAAARRLLEMDSTKFYRSCDTTALRNLDWEILKRRLVERIRLLSR